MCSFYGLFALNGLQMECRYFDLARPMMKLIYSQTIKLESNSKQFL